MPRGGHCNVAAGVVSVNVTDYFWVSSSDSGHFGRRCTAAGIDSAMPKDVQVDYQQVDFD